MWNLKMLPDSRARPHLDPDYTLQSALNRIQNLLANSKLIRGARYKLNTEKRYKT